MDVPYPLHTISEIQYNSLEEMALMKKNATESQGISSYFWEVMCDPITGTYHLCMGDMYLPFLWCNLGG